MRIGTKLHEFEKWYQGQRGYPCATARNYAKRVKIFIKDVGNLQAPRITDKHIREWFLRLQSRGVKPLAVRGYFWSLWAVLQFYKKVYKQDVPGKLGVKLPAAEKNAYVECLTDEEIQKLLSAIDEDTFAGSRFRCYIEILLSSAMRPHEPLQLTREVNPIVQIVGKGNKIRQVPLNERALSYIQRFLARRTDNSQALFVSGAGQKIGYDCFRKYFAVLRNRAGIRKSITLHDIRHTVATRLLRETGNAKLVQMLLGHNDVLTTLKFYVGVDADYMLQVSNNCLRFPEPKLSTGGLDIVRELPIIVANEKQSSN